MRLSFKRFIISSLILAAVLWVIAKVCLLWLWPVHDFPGLLPMIAGIWALSAVFYFWLVSTVDRDPRKFNSTYLLQTTLKLFIYLAFIVYYMLSYKTFAVSFAVCFLLVYAIFTVFEVFSIIKFVKSKTDKAVGPTKRINNPL